MAAAVILYYALNHHRIEFAGVTLELACQVIRDYPSVVLIKILVVVVQLSKALGHALTYSFGSIAFGSLLVAIIETAEAYVTYLEHHANGFVKKLLKILA